MKAILLGCITFALSLSSCLATPPSTSTTQVAQQESPIELTIQPTETNVTSASISHVYLVATHQEFEQMYVVRHRSATVFRVSNPSISIPLKADPHPYADDYPSLISRLELTGKTGKRAINRESYIEHRFRFVAYNPASYRVIPYLPRILGRKRSFYPC